MEKDSDLTGLWANNFKVTTDANEFDQNIVNLFGLDASVITCDRTQQGGVNDEKSYFQKLIKKLLRAKNCNTNKVSPEPGSTSQQVEETVVENFTDDDQRDIMEFLPVSQGTPITFTPEIIATVLNFMKSDTDMRSYTRDIIPKLMLVNKDFNQSLTQNAVTQKAVEIATDEKGLYNQKLEGIVYILNNLARMERERYDWVMSDDENLRKQRIKKYARKALNKPDRFSYGYFLGLEMFFPYKSLTILIFTYKEPSHNANIYTQDIHLINKRRFSEGSYMSLKYTFEKNKTEANITNYIRKLIILRVDGSPWLTQPGDTYSIRFGIDYDSEFTKYKTIKEEISNDILSKEIVEVFYDLSGPIVFEVHGASRFSRTMNAYAYDIKKYVNGYRERVENSQTLPLVQNSQDVKKSPEDEVEEVEEVEEAQPVFLNRFEPQPHMYAYYPLLTINQIQRIEQIFDTDNNYTYYFDDESIVVTQFQTSFITTINKILEQNFKKNDKYAYENADKLVNDILTRIEAQIVNLNPGGNENLVFKLETNNPRLLKIYKRSLDKGSLDKGSLDVQPVIIRFDSIASSLQPLRGGNRNITSKMQKTNERFAHKKRNYVVYVGPRGGRYIKTAGRYISLSKLQ